MRGKVGLVLLAVLLGAAPLAAAPADPVAVVHSIYAGAANRKMAFGLDPGERREFFSKSLVALWDLADAKSNPTGEEVGAIDFDPSTNSQGADVKSYTVVSNQTGGNNATVVVKLVLDNWIRRSPEDDIVRYVFVLEDGRWMIDDMGGSADGEGWTIRKLLEINAQDRTRSKE